MSSSINISGAPDEEWAHHGRHPMLELRHTVDDVLQAATSRVFLNFRAVCNRNRDTIIVLSESAREVRPRAGAGPARGVILTDKHLYVITMPTSALFAPSAGGGVFPWRDFGRLCFLKSTPHVVFQFVSGVVALLFSTHREVERLCKVVFSTTGQQAEEISLVDLDAAKRGGREFNPSFRGFDLESNSTATQMRAGGGAFSAGTSTSGVPAGAGPALRSSPTVAPASAIAGGAGAGQPPSPGRVGADAGNIDNMLRFILGGAEGGTNYETLYPTAETQTAIETSTAAVQARAPTVDRATSPIRYLPEGARAEPINIGWGPLGGAGAAGRSEERSDTMSSTSDFDHNDVWRSLHGTPFKLGSGADPAAAMMAQQQQQQQRGGAAARRAPSPGATQRGGALSPPLSRTATHFGQAAERRIHFDASRDLSATVRSTYSAEELRGSLASDDGAAAGSDDTQAPHRIPTGGSSLSSAADVLRGALGDEAAQVDATVGGRGSAVGGGSVSAMSLNTLDREPQPQAPPEALKRQQSQRATLALDSFLGVLATYRSALQYEGVDSTSKLLKLSDAELQEVMDAAGIAKPGHRTLLMSKVNLAKQARAAKKVMSS